MTRHGLPVTVGMALLVSAGLLAQGRDKPIQTVKDGIMDQIRVYVAAPPGLSTPVRLRPFAADAAALGKDQDDLPDETKLVQRDVPTILRDHIVTGLKKASFTDVDRVEAGAEVPAGAVVVEGQFTEVDPGSRAKRFWVGFGAGKSATSAKGTVMMGGTLLADFQQRRIGVMGVAGGDSLSNLREQAGTIGDDVAAFLVAWVNGKRLK